MKTLRKFSLALLSMILLFTLTSCDGSGTGTGVSDTAKVEKSVLSVMNAALGTDFTNDESLRSKANYIWDRSIKTDGSSGRNLYICPKAKTENCSG